MIDKLSIYKAFQNCKDFSYSNCICVNCICNQKFSMNRTICEELCDTLYKKCAEISAISNATERGI